MGRTWTSGDRRREAGEAAERQMRFYLDRAFRDRPEVQVINGLRLESDVHTTESGRPDASQIDHLVIHRRGMFIVESKSIHGTVRIRRDGAGGDEWVRAWGRGPQEGMNSPLAQAQRQAQFLRESLQAVRTELRGKVVGAKGLLSRVVVGTDQRGFQYMPIQVIVAISEKGIIERPAGWEPPFDRWRNFVCKADQVAKKIDEELARHRKASRPLAQLDGSYGLWSMTAEEAAGVVEYLRDRHSPLQAAAPDQLAQPASRANAPAGPGSPAIPTCRHCGSPDLSARWGKYGPYWSCAACTKNTAMPTVCSCCGAEGAGGRIVRIRKEGARYYRACEACGIEERIWTEPNSA